MKKLYIAEKPSVAQEFAKALKIRAARKDGYLEGEEAVVTSDVENLEEILWKEVGSKEDYEQEYGEKPLGEFVREIVGLDMNAAKEAFSEYLSDTNMDSRQIYFVNQIVEYIKMDWYSG